MVPGLRSPLRRPGSPGRKLLYRTAEPAAFRANASGARRAAHHRPRSDGYGLRGPHARSPREVRRTSPANVDTREADSPAPFQASKNSSVSTARPRKLEAPFGLGHGRIAAEVG